MPDGITMSISIYNRKKGLHLSIDCDHDTYTTASGLNVNLPIFLENGTKAYRQIPDGYASLVPIEIRFTNGNYYENGVMSHLVVVGEYHTFSDTVSLKGWGNLLFTEKDEMTPAIAFINTLLHTERKSWLHYRIQGTDAISIPLIEARKAAERLEQDCPHFRHFYFDDIPRYRRSAGELLNDVLTHQRELDTDYPE